MWLKNSPVNILKGAVIQHTEKDKAPHPPLLKLRHQWVNYFLVMIFFLMNKLLISGEN